MLLAERESDVSDSESLTSVGVRMGVMLGVVCLETDRKRPSGPLSLGASFIHEPQVTSTITSRLNHNMGTNAALVTKMGRAERG